MKASTLYRLSGVSSIISVVLLLIFGVGALVFDYLNIPQFIIIRLSGGFAHIFFVFTLLGIYFKQFEKMGVLGLIGFVLAMVGNVVFITDILSSAYVSVQGELFGPVGLALPLGLLILAVANHRAGVMPKWAGWLMVLGHAVNIISNTTIGLAAPIMLQISLFAAGILWMGLALLRTPTQAVDSQMN